MNRFVFQIGFNKCATRSLCHLFEMSNIPSLHWSQDGGIFCKSMLINFISGKNLISDQYLNKVLFADMEYIYNNTGLPFHGYCFYDRLHTQYPNSKFILNIRPIDNWLQSRINHDGGKYLSHYQSLLSMSKEDTIDFWRIHFINHIQNVKNYFKNFPNKLVVFDIENDSINKIIDFFPEYSLNPKNWLQFR